MGALVRLVPRLLMHNSGLKSYICLLYGNKKMFMSGKIYRNDYFVLAVLLMLTLPILFINRQISTDWGGDYAMYINEALNISRLHPVTDTHYVYNENAPMLGPKVYPVGFPLLLAPVVLLFGNNVPVLIVFMSVLLITTAPVLFLFFKNFFSKAVSLILTLMIVYNPWMLIFKNEILADIPFTLFFVLAMVLYLRKAPAWLTGFVMGYAALIKAAGFVLPVAFVLYYFFNLLKRKNRTKELVLPVVYSLLFVFIVNKVIFHIPSGLGLYSSNFDFTGFKHNFLLNIALYIEIFESFFYRNLHDWKFIMLITQSVMLTFVIIGMVNAKKNPVFFVPAVFLLMLFVYPYHSSGFRFLLPIMPFLSVYAVNGFKSIKWNFTAKKNILILSAALILLGQYVPEIIKLSKAKPTVLNGPLEPASQQAFDYLKKNVKPGETVLFLKPRVLALFTGINSVCNELSDDNEKMEKLIKDNNVRYILTNENLKNKAVLQYINQNADKLLLKWKNEKFELYGVKTGSGTNRKR